MISEIDALLSIGDRLKRWWQAKTNMPIESVATRFLRLFESHGVHRNQIPRFFGNGITLVDVQSEEVLLRMLNDQILDAACQLFAVRREWLDGAEPQVHPLHDFYKQPERFRYFIRSLKAANPNGNLRGTLYFPCEKRAHEALLILEECIGSIGEKQISRLHLCNNWSVTYWKSRGYMTACVAIAWRDKAYINGRDLPAKDIDRLGSGEVLLGWGGEGLPMGSALWHPDDMALYPKKYLERVDPERHKFGYAFALKLWLDLAEEGYMDIGIDKNSVELFKRELTKYEGDV